MELRHLQYFLMVAREGTISGAANVLHISQPSLSRQMQDLEHELGCKLFERGSRRIELTEAGMRLRRRAEEIVDLVGRTESEFLVSADTLAGEVRIGGGETQAMALIADAIAELQEAYPLLRFSLFSGNAEDVGERLAVQTAVAQQVGVVHGRVVQIDVAPFRSMAAVDAAGIGRQLARGQRGLRLARIPEALVELHVNVVDGLGQMGSPLSFPHHMGRSAGGAGS